MDHSNLFFFEHINDPFYQTIALLGIFIILFGLVSLFVKERLYLTESLVATIVGIIFGPHCASILQPLAWFPEPQFNKILWEFTRIIISMQVMAVGLSVPNDYIKKQWKSIIMLLGPLMCIMWAVSALIVKLVMGYDRWEIALMIGACLAPTDPVLAHAVIKGKFANRYIPSHLRNLLSVESGANDGLGFPFLMIPVLIIAKPNEVIKFWFIKTWLYEIFLSILIGFLMGYGGRILLEKSEKYRLIDKESFLAYSIALALSITGLVALISSDDLLAVFIAGNVFAHDDRFNQATKEAHFQEVLDMLFNISFFIFFGSILPWRAFYDLHVGYLILTGILILLLRRLPWVLLMKPAIPQLKSWREAFFAGWFGPMGVGAIFFSMVVYHYHGISHEVATEVFTVVSFVVFCSIVIHGITVPMVHASLQRRAKRRLKREARRNKIAHDMEEGLMMGKTTLQDIPLSLESSITDYNEQGDFAQYVNQTYNVPTEKDLSDADYAEYEDTIDARGMTPSQLRKKLARSGPGTVNSPMDESINVPPMASLPLERADTYESTYSVSSQENVKEDESDKDDHPPNI